MNHIIRNIYFGQVDFESKIVENIFRWFEYVERRPVDYAVKKVDQMERSE